MVKGVEPLTKALEHSTHVGNISGHPWL